MDGPAVLEEIESEDIRSVVVRRDSEVPFKSAQTSCGV